MEVQGSNANITQQPSEARSLNHSANTPICTIYRRLLPPPWSQPAKIHEKKLDIRWRCGSQLSLIGTGSAAGRATISSTLAEKG